MEDIEELATTLDGHHPNALHQRSSIGLVSSKSVSSSQRRLPLSTASRSSKSFSTLTDNVLSPSVNDNVLSPSINGNNAPSVAVEDGLSPTTTLNGADHFLPGQHRIFIKTWGCSHNNSDSEYMAGLLAAQGYSVCFTDNDRSSAHVWLLNSCTVKNPSEQTFVNAIQLAKANGKKVVVAGCVPQAQRNGSAWEGVSAIGVQQIDRVVEAVEETLQGRTVRFLGKKMEHDSIHGIRKAGGARLDMPKIRKNPFIEVIPINTGCLNQCTYCKTKHARGDLGSYHPDAIVQRVKSVLEEDTGAYGRDIGTDLPTLLKQVVAVLQEAYEKEGKECMLRVGMTNPPYILADLEPIAQILNHPRVYKFLHVPVQSASDRVLDDMRRQYTKAEFLHVVNYLREHVPNITIATDIICGFPTETDEDHEESVQLVQQLRFPILHISQFYPRPGTPAARMNTRVPTQIVKARSRKITRLFESYTTNDRLMGQTIRIWITDETHGSKEQDENRDPSRLDACWVGHDAYYHQILLDKNDPKVRGLGCLLGMVCNVKIVRIGKYFAVGEIADKSNVKLANSNTVMKTSSSKISESLRNKASKVSQTLGPKIMRTKSSYSLIWAPLAVAASVALVAYLIYQMK